MRVVLNFDGSKVTDADITDIFGEDILATANCTATFNSSCSEWESDPVYNLMYLRQQQRYANDMLINRGHLFLNEVYDMLGLPRTMLGQLLGWSSKTSKIVDFGLASEQNKNFVNGLTADALLDFNVCGIVCI